MFTGRWIFLAIASLSGLLIVFDFRLTCILFISLILIRVILERKAAFLLAYSICFVLFLCLGFINEKNNVSTYTSQKITTTITFQEPPIIDGDRLRAVVATDKEKVQLQYVIQSEQEKANLLHSLKSGTICEVSGELLEPNRPTNQHAFDYAQYLKRKNIHWMLQPTKNSFQDCHQSKKSIFHTLKNFREKGIHLTVNNFSEQLLPYANALVFGERAFFAEDILNAYQSLGIIHLLAISGLHVGFIMGFLYYLFKRIGLTKEVIYWIFVGMMPIYAILAGANPPVIRATLMILLALTSKKFKLPFTTIDTVAISFMIFLIFDPYIIYQAGFQLSFSVSLALILMANNLKEISFLKGLLATSLTSMIISLPILIWHFYEFSIVSPIANMLFVPFYSLIVLPTIIFVWFLQFGHEGIFMFLIDLLSTLISYSEQLVMYISSWKYTSIVTGKPSFIATAWIVLGVIMYFVLREKEKFRRFAIYPIVVIFIVYFTVLTHPKEGEVVFIDVGQGDSIFIQLPFNRGTYLIDTGGQSQFPQEEWKVRSKPFDTGKDILIPFLKSKGVQKIDKLILTHADIDHMGAGEELLKQINIKEVHIPPNSWEKPMMRNLLKLAQEKNIQITVSKAGLKWENKSGSFSFLYPIKEEYLDNDSSLVLHADFGGLKWLFTGDLENEGEMELLRTYGEIEIDLLKVGHHGSKTSTSIELLESIKPEYAVISAGKNNRYGHPHPMVLENLRNFNVKVFRIDQNGALHYKFSHENGTFQTVPQ